MLIRLFNRVLLVNFAAFQIQSGRIPVESRLT